MLCDHTAEVEADLQRYYRVDLRDLWTGRLTLRRLRVLLDGLPPESAWATAIRRREDYTPGKADLDAVRWGTVHELLAALIDATNSVKWAVFQSQSNRTVKPYDPFPRPGSGPKRKPLSAKNRARIDGWIKDSRAHAQQRQAQE